MANSKMEFIKLNDDRYLVVGTPNIVLSKKEMLEAKEKNLIELDILGNGCQKNNIAERKEIEKELKEIDKDETISEAKQTKTRHNK